MSTTQIIDRNLVHVAVPKSSPTWQGHGNYHRIFSHSSRMATWMSSSKMPMSREKHNFQPKQGGTSRMD